MSSETKSPSVIGSARIISGCILLSRILGFIRDMLCAGFFGKVWDAFIVAFTIPNLFRRFFGEGALSAAFIPTFSDYLEHKPQSETQRLLNAMITLLTGLLTLIALIIIAGSYLLPLFSRDKEGANITAPLLRIMIPYLPLICLVGLFTAILNTLKHFAMPALASVALNICWIGGVVIAPIFGKTEIEQVTIIAWSILLGGVVEVLIQIPPLIKRKIGYKPLFLINHPGIKEIGRLMIPAIAGLAVFQINTFLDIVVAKIFAGEGAVSALYFGNRLMQFPLAMIGISMAQAVFPFLAEHVLRQDLTSLKKELNSALHFCMFVAMPATVGLIVLAQPTIIMAFDILPKTIFGSKGFVEQATDRTTWVLIYYSAGIWAYSALQITTRAFYALKDMKTPVRIGIWMVIVNLVLNIILVQFMKEAGIALATAITGVANLFILTHLLDAKLTRMGHPEPDITLGEGSQHKILRGVYPEPTNKIASPIRARNDKGEGLRMTVLGVDLFWPFIKSLGVSLLMGLGCYFILMVIPTPQTGIHDKGTILILGLAQVILPIIAGIGLYLGLSFLLQPKSLKQLGQGLRNRN